MAEDTNRQWLLDSRPEGMVEPSNFRWNEAEVPEPGDGQVLVRNLLLSLDPAMRGWMRDEPSYVPPVELGAVMRGGCVAEVVESRREGYEPGDLVTGIFGWQDYALSEKGDGSGIRAVPEGVEPTVALGPLGMTGLTAYFGLKEVGQPQEGETVVVSAAAGATGSVVGQLAKLWGCRAVGIAGGPEKCERLTDEFGFDAAVDYKNDDVRARLGEVCPDGVDVYFDNVGGPILDAALANLAMRGRVVICGAISTYNDERQAPGPANYLSLLVNRGRMQGFIVFDFFDRMDDALAELVPLVRDGAIHQRADVRDGLEHAPEALLSLFDGSNDGKLSVRIADPDGTR